MIASEEKLNELLDKIVDESKKKGQDVNQKKMGWMVVSESQLNV